MDGLRGNNRNPKWSPEAVNSRSSPSGCQMNLLVRSLLQECTKHLRRVGITQYPFRAQVPVDPVWLLRRVLAVMHTRSALAQPNWEP